jgi:hypothetical protein
VLLAEQKATKVQSQVRVLNSVQLWRRSRRKEVLEEAAVVTVRGRRRASWAALTAKVPSWLRDPLAHRGHIELGERRRRLRHKRGQLVVTDLDQFRVQRRDRAGGVIHEYHLVA